METAKAQKFPVIKALDSETYPRCPPVFPEFKMGRRQGFRIRFYGQFLKV
jgi:hypothetical protein